MKPSLVPMEAQSVEAIPEDSGWQYEPKWDGFRCLVFRDGAKVRLKSKSGQPLERYFPELVEALRALKAPRFVLDGEIIIARGKSLDFDALLQRIHPAETRIRKLAAQTPATLIVFDLLADAAGRSLLARSLAGRRERLESFARKFFPRGGNVRLSPAATQLAAAKKWFRSAGAAVSTA